VELADRSTTKEAPRDRKTERATGAGACEARAHDERRKVHFGRAFVAGLVCFALWLLLYSPTLLRNAEAAPLGARRDAAITVLRPIAATSRALGFAAVVGALERALGRSAPGPTRGTSVGVLAIAPGLRRGGPQRHASQGKAARSHGPQRQHFGGHAGVGAKSRGGSGSGGGLPTLPTLPIPSAANPLRVLVIGDSLGIDLGETLVDDLAGTGVVQPVLDGHVSTGLARPDYFDWPAELQADLEHDRPEVVVVFMGANDAQGMLIGDVAYQFGTQPWEAAYEARAASLMEEATEAGARVVWVGLPPMASPGLDQAMEVIDRLDEQAAAANPAVLYVPSRAVLGGPGGSYAAYLPGPSGALVEVRTPDGIHLTNAGAKLLARAVIRAMDHAWHLSLAP
jgi:lysophospholipase L1-like esterase